MEEANKQLVKVGYFDNPTLEEVLNYDKEGYPKVKFKNSIFDDLDLILVGGAITTLDRFCSFRVSIAHLYENGDISRHGAKISKFEDLMVEMPVIKG